MNNADKRELNLIVHNIRSAYNVGAIFRTADGAGVAKIYLTGYTPAPWRKTDPPYKTSAQRMIEKTALGAEKFVPWKKTEDISELISLLKKKKVYIYALEQTSESVFLGSVKVKFPGALILGNETQGLPEGVLKQCDKIFAIPMRGKKESLNVSIAAGIAIYQILK